MLQTSHHYRRHLKVTRKARSSLDWLSELDASVVAILLLKTRLPYLHSDGHSKTQRDQLPFSV